MMKRAVVLLGLLACQGAFAAESGTMIDGTDLDSIVAIARDYGSATVGTQQTGQAKIVARVDGISYVAFFQNCSSPRVCDDINLYAGFLDVKPSQERINAWNASKRFGRAYIDPVGDAAIEMDINLKNGISPANLSASFAIWRLILRQFVDYLKPDMPVREPVVAPPPVAEPAAPTDDTAEGAHGAPAGEEETSGDKPAGH